MRDDIRAWWEAPADLRWVREFLNARGITTQVRILIGLSAVVLAMVPLAEQFTPKGPQGLPARVVVGLVLVVTLLWAFRWWLRPWPGPRTSGLFVVWADFAIGISCLLDGDPLAGASGTIGFVTMTLYITVMHSARAIVLHICWSLLVLLILCGELAFGATDDVFLALAKACMGVVVLGAVPLLIHYGFRMVRIDTVEAQVDPLTGFLNRRGFEAQVQRAWHAPSESVAVTLIDLDKFKRINDTFGHQAGDDVLVRTADKIRESVGPHALVARLGGEEFVVLGSVATRNAVEDADRIRRAISRPTKYGTVTASVGVATMSSDGTDTEFEQRALYRLLSAADEAMYRAKRDGGDTVRTAVAAFE